MCDTPHARTNRAARRLLYGVVGAALLSIPTLAVADEVFSLSTTVSIPGLASFDISFVDPSVHAYFLADRTNKTIDVLDTKTLAHTTLDAGGFQGAVLGSNGKVNNNVSGPDGVLTVHQGRHDGDNDGDDNSRVQVWAGDGDSTIKVLEYPSGSVVKVISTGGQDRADEGCWDPEDHLVLFANDADSPPFISFISTDTLSIVKQIKFDGLAGDGVNATNGIEQCQWNAREHRFYLNIPEVNGSGSDTAPGNVVVINPHNFKMTAFVVPIADCAGPQGMAIGPAPQIALGCNAKTIPGGVRNSVVVDEENPGNVIAVLANEGGTDEAWFNPGDGHFFFANSTPGSTAPLTPQLLGIVDSRGDQLDTSVVTQAASAVGAHSVAADPVSNEVFVPVAGGINIYTPSARDDHFVFRDH
jgi:hypothetical protein